MPEHLKITIKNIAARFGKNEDGAITVDWIVMTAACVGLAGLSGAMVLDATEAVSDNIGTELSTKEVATGI